QYRTRIDQVVRAGLADTDLDIRRAAAEAAGLNNVAGTAGRIVELSKQDKDGAAQYIRALGRLADPAGLDVVLAAATGPRGIIGEYALEGLANFNDGRAMQALDALLKSNDPTTRARVANILIRGKSSAAADLLLTVVGDPSPLVRSAALIGLGEHHDRRGFDAAIKALQDDDVHVRAFAASTAAKLAQSPADRAAATDALLPLTDARQNQFVRATAILALGQLKDPRSIPVLKQAASEPPAPPNNDAFATSPSLAAVRALALMGTPQSL